MSNLWKSNEDPSPDYHVLFDDLRYNDDDGKAARFYKIEERRKHMFSMIGARSSRALERAADMAVEPEEVPEGETLRHREIFYAANLEAHAEPQQWIRDWAPDALQTASRLRAKVESLREELLIARIDSFLADEIIRDHQSIVATRKALPVEVLAEILNGAATDPEKDPLVRFQRLFILMRVCLAWQRCILHNPRFWTDMQFPSALWGNSDHWQRYVEERREAEEVWWRRTPPSKERLMLEGLKTRMERAGGLPLDVVLAGDKKLAPMMLEVLVKASNRWGTFRLKSPENVAPGVVANVGGTLLDESATEHPWFPELAQIRGRLPRLRSLALEGHYFRGRCSTVMGLTPGSEATPDIATSIKLLVDRGCNLVTLELDALMGITAAGAVVLLTQIPTLKSFWLKEVADKEGIMTKAFLHSLKTVPVTVDFLKIEGARGLPASPEDLGLLRQLLWLDSLLGMLALQYDHKLSTLDIQYGFKFTNLCPFTKASHTLLEERLGKFFEMGKKLVVHREGEECSNTDWPNHQFSTPEEATDTKEEDDDEEEEGLESDAYENGVSVDGASDKNLEL
ncbi:hypothetical protein C8R43DRAFT_944472 [Mycena crocata]|nr:hypothetical protein C8R43DRAFT_944472 [Mycena crocata]